MGAFRTIVESGDLCSLGFVILLLTFVGGRMVDRSPLLQLWGWRLAAAAFVVYAAYAILLSRATDPAELAVVLIRAIIAAGLVLGLAWVLLPFAAFLIQTFGARPLRSGRSALRSLHVRWISKNQEIERLRTALASKNAELVSTQRQRQLADDTAHADRESQRRRDNARANCELLFTQHASELEHRFPRTVFDQFVAKYMGDERSPEEVEQRAEQLCGALREQRQLLDPARRFSSLTELTAWYHDQRRQIQTTGLDPDTTEVLLVNLEIQYEQLLRRFIQET